MAQYAMWCPCFVMYNHNQLVIMKKVLMMLCSLLLLACSKEDIPQSEHEQTASTTAELDISADLSGLRALDFKLKNGKVALDLGDKTEIPVWTAIYVASDGLYNAQPVYSKLLMWQIDKDDRTKIHYKGPLELRLANSTRCWISAVIVPEDAKHGLFEWNSNGNKFIANHWVEWYSSLGDKLRPVSETKKVSINAPYMMRTELTTVPDPREGVLKLVYSNDRPASERKFKPKGYFLRFKIQNKFDHEVKIEKLRSYAHTNNPGFTSSKLAVILASAYNGERGKTHGGNPGVGFATFKDFGFDVPGGVITIPANGESDETFLLYLPEFDKDFMHLFRLDIIPSSGTTFQDAYYTPPLLTKEAEAYTTGKVYDVKLVLRRLPNPLTLISKFPLDKTGNNFVKSPTESYTGNYDDTFSSVGYYTFEEAEARFARAKQYANGGNTKWHMPTTGEMGLIFGAYFYPKESPGEEWVQIGKQRFWSNAYYKKYQSQSGKFLDFYALRFCKITDEQRGQGRLFIGPGVSRGDSYSSHKRGKYALTDNSMRYAFRYYYDEVKKLLTIKAKYVGEAPNIRTVDDIQDKNYYGGEIDWSTVSEELTLPLYGIEIAEVHGQKIGDHTYRSPGRPHYGWMSWDKDSFEVEPGETLGVAFYSPIARYNYDLKRGDYVSDTFLFAPRSVDVGSILAIHYYNQNYDPKKYLAVPVYLFKEFN